MTDVNGSLFNILPIATREHTEGANAVPVSDEAVSSSDDVDEEEEEEEEVEEVRRGAWEAANNFL